eukprot:NODE_16677_length_983_cov_4.778037.p2 GENE.NODE_16677_length_983_cov_4.778037~~NODE_16677_length_983_cov_4.778037.p2  ORF type:complete len:195 (-),score=19.05 NODE_16677_length_983_cov_4.778037:15-599(-)
MLLAEQDIVMTVITERISSHRCKKGRKPKHQLWFVNPVQLPAEIIQSFIAPSCVKYIIVLPMDHHHLFIDKYLELLPRDHTVVVGSSAAGLRHKPPIHMTPLDGIRTACVEFVRITEAYEELLILITLDSGEHVAITTHMITCGSFFVIPTDQNTTVFVNALSRSLASRMAGRRAVGSRRRCRHLLANYTRGTS